MWPGAACLLTESGGSICAEKDEQLLRQQNYCFLYPPGCSTNETDIEKETPSYNKAASTL